MRSPTSSTTGTFLESLPMSLWLPSWRFVERDRARKARDPLQAELLSQENFDVAESLVRESIQNSIDARLDTSQPVHVRIFVSGALKHTPIGTGDYFKDFWPHVQASNRGGHVDASLENQQCRFVVIEDFNTSGLTGDYTASSAEPGESNNFYHFLRAEGISGKSEGNLGRWGVGKYVFPKASGINTFFALTRRTSEERTLLIGQSVLENHELEGKEYEPDGWFADFEEDSGFQLPLLDQDLIEAFSKFWAVSRTTETGLSVVVPYIGADFTGQEFKNAVVKSYFGAILAGNLTVEVVQGGDGISTLIHAGNLVQIAHTLTGNIPPALLEYLQLYASIPEIPAENKYVTAPFAGSDKWEKSKLEETTAAEIRQKLEYGQTVQITVPQVLTLKKPAAQVESSYRVILKYVDGIKAKAHYIRVGVQVSNAHSSTMPSTLAICLIEDPALVQMLGDAENPAHTTWTDNDKVKAKYTYAKVVIDNIKQSPHRLRTFVQEALEDEERIVFADIFKVPLQADGTIGRVSKRKGSRGKNPSPRTETTRPAPQKLVAVELHDLNGSVEITPTTAGQKSLASVDLEFAYDTRKGNPFEKWKPYDFSVSELEVDLNGASVHSASRNRLKLTVTEPENFRAIVRGFDPKRNLQINPKGSSKPWQS